MATLGPFEMMTDTRHLVVLKIHFTYFSIIVLAVTAIVAVVVSYTRPAQDPQQIDGLTWWSLSKKRKQLKQESKILTEDKVKPAEEKAGLTQYKETDVDKAVEVEMESVMGDNLAVQQTYNSIVPAPWCHILNVCAVLLLALLGFLVAFFA